MHSLHVDDCADPYVALAEHSRRDEVAQQASNISNEMYEPAQEIEKVLVRSYGLTAEWEAIDPSRKGMISEPGATPPCPPSLAVL